MGDNTVLENTYEFIHSFVHSFIQLLFCSRGNDSGDIIGNGQGLVDILTRNGT